MSRGPIPLQQAERGLSHGGSPAGGLPGPFSDVGLTLLFPVPASTLREVIDQLDDPALASAWTDDTPLGWVYQ